jgi:hypothetical protein
MLTYKTTNTLSPTAAAYIAGLIDGEGTISLTRKHKYEHRQLVGSISNTELALLGFYPDFTDTSEKRILAERGVLMSKEKKVQPGIQAGSC